MQSLILFGGSFYLHLYRLYQLLFTCNYLAWINQPVPLSTFYLTSLLICLIIVSLVFCLYVLTKNASIIDTFWSVGISAACLIICVTHVPFSWVQYAPLILIQLWGIRLASFMFVTRILKSRTRPPIRTFNPESSPTTPISNATIHSSSGASIIVDPFCVSHVHHAATDNALVLCGLWGWHWCHHF